MAKIEVEAKDKSLVYCRGCGSRETWERYPERDMHYYTGDAGSPVIGGVFEYAFKCKVCGAVTLRLDIPLLQITK